MKLTKSLLTIATIVAVNSSSAEKAASTETKGKKPASVETTGYQMECKIKPGNYVGWRYKGKGDFVEKSISINWWNGHYEAIIKLVGKNNKKKSESVFTDGAVRAETFSDLQVVAYTYDLSDESPWATKFLEMLRVSNGPWSGRVYSNGVEFEFEQCSKPKAVNYYQE